MLWRPRARERWRLRERWPQKVYPRRDHGGRSKPHKIPSVHASFIRVANAEAFFRLAGAPSCFHLSFTSFSSKALIEWDLLPEQIVDAALVAVLDRFLAERTVSTSSDFSSGIALQMGSVRLGGASGAGVASSCVRTGVRPHACFVRRASGFVLTHHSDKAPIPVSQSPIVGSYSCERPYRVIHSDELS